MDKVFSIDSAFIYYPAAILFICMCFAAWSTTLLTLPGNWFVIALAVLFAWIFSGNAAGRGVSWVAVGVAVALVVIGEVIEFAAGAGGAAKQGASKRAMALALIGAFLGSIVGVILGSPVPLVGSFILALFGGAGGAFAGAYAGEKWKGRSEDARLAAGKGAFYGKLFGTLGKLTAGLIAVVVVSFDALF